MNRANAYASAWTMFFMGALLWGFYPDTPQILLFLLFGLSGFMMGILEMTR